MKPETKLYAKIKKNSKPPIELLLPSFILYLANKPENATKTQLIYHLDTHKFSGYTVKKQNIFTSNFTGNLNFKIGDETTIEINSTFQTKDLDKLVKVINSDIELQNEQFFSCFEEAVSEYAAQVNRFNIRENLYTLRGQSTGSDFTHKNIIPNQGNNVKL